jgi:hypothetical protein
MFMSRYYVLAHLFAAALFSSCSQGSSPSDSGFDSDTDPAPCSQNVECDTTAFCTADKICTQVDTSLNHASGTFDVIMNADVGSASVIGKLNGKHLYFELGYFEINPLDKNYLDLNLLNFLTNNLYELLTITLPKECPLNEPIPIGFGSTTVPCVVRRVQVDNKGNVQGDPILTGEATSGQITLTSFGVFGGLSKDHAIGSLEVLLRPIIPAN